MDEVIVIVGPTGVGKTKLSIELAKYFDGEIISGDSVQVYRELDIGSAKIKEEEKEGIPHYLMDIKDVSESYSVYEFQREVREKIELIVNKGKVPILVGGTGLYLKAALYDYEFNEENYEFDSYDNLTNQEAYDLLKSLDPVEASKLHPNNRVRVIRDLNMIKHGESNKSDRLAKQAHKPLYNVKFIGLTAPREMVYDRINKRVDLMVKEGLIQEVENLYQKYYKNNYSAFKAIGYKELFEYFNGNISLQEALELIKKKSRNYAKRQYTWFNNQFPVKWFDVNFNDFKITVKEIINYLEH